MMYSDDRTLRVWTGSIVRPSGYETDFPDAESWVPCSERPDLVFPESEAARSILINMADDGVTLPFR
jgi:hypothetical protein